MHSIFYTPFFKKLHVIFVCKCAVCIMFLPVFLHFNQLFQNFTKTILRSIKSKQYKGAAGGGEQAY